MIVTTWLPIELKFNNSNTDYSIEYNWQELESILY